MPKRKPGTYWFTCKPPDPPLLLRRVVDDVGITDVSFLHGDWVPTKLIVDYEFGHEDDVDEVTEEQARATCPAAFT